MALAQLTRWTRQTTSPPVAPLTQIESSTSDPNMCMIYVPFITLASSRCDSKCCDFNIAYLDPKYDSWIAANRLRPGSVILVKEFVRRGRPVQDVNCQYIEILDLELKPLNTPYVYDALSLTHFLENLDFECLPVQGMIKLHTWFDMVPSWRLENRSNLGRILLECDPSHVEEIQSKLTSIANVAENWSTDPSKPGPLLVRVLKKTKILFYMPTKIDRNFPTMSSYKVADNSGTCSLLVWDHANERDLYTKIFMGSVLLLKDYRVKNDFAAKYGNDRTHRKKYSVELIVEGYPVYKAPKSLEEARVTLVKQSSQMTSLLNLPDEKYNFIQLEDQSLLPNSTIVDISGVVVGITRYYRITPMKNRVGKTFVFRFVEVYDVINKRCHQIEVFIHDQLESHDDLKVGDHVVFTFLLYVCRHSYPVNAQLTYFSTTQESEYPNAIIKKLETSSETKAKKWNRSTWIGGANWFTWACLLEKHTKEMVKGVMHFAGNNVKQNLQAMAYFQCKSFGFNGVVASIEYCTMQKMHLKYISTEINRIEDVAEEVFPIFTIPDLDNVLRDVEIVGTKHPNVLTFPVKGFTKAASVIQEAIHFPPTTILELMHDKRVNHIITADDLKCKSYFRLLLLSKDKTCAVWCIFTPPPPYNSGQVPKSLIDLLLVNYRLNGGKGGFLAHCGFAPSDEYLENLMQTKNDILSQNFTFFLQAYKHCSEETEITYTYAMRHK